MPRSKLAALALLAAATACSADPDRPLGPGLIVEAAGEAGPHFVRASADGPDDFGNLRVVWKEAGLGASELIAYLATANATALYACQNSSGNFSRDAKKQEVVGPVSAETGFASDRNGTIAGRVTLLPPDPVTPPDPIFPPDPCSRGQSLVLVQARYTDVVIADVTNGISEPVPGAFCRTLFANAYPPDPC
jgi:hypothetical protein